jgi:hypothetical protein
MNINYGEEQEEKEGPCLSRLPTATEELWKDGS